MLEEENKEKKGRIGTQEFDKYKTSDIPAPDHFVDTAKTDDPTDRKKAAI